MLIKLMPKIEENPKLLFNTSPKNGPKAEASVTLKP